MKLIEPDLAVALGATAAQSLLGKAVPITKMRGQVIERDDGLRVFLTIHPSFILRIREAVDAAAERERLRGISRLFGQLFQSQEVARDLVLANVPPAWVHHVRGRGDRGWGPGAEADPK